MEGKFIILICILVGPRDLPLKVKNLRCAIIFDISRGTEGAIKNNIFSNEIHRRYIRSMHISTYIRETLMKYKHVSNNIWIKCNFPILTLKHILLDFLISMTDLISDHNYLLLLLSY